MSFADDVNRFVMKTKNKIKVAFSESANRLFSQIVMRTPTYFDHEPTSGHTKFNWQASTNGSATERPGTDKQGDATITAIKAVTSVLSLENLRVYLANPTEAATWLEYGLYPKSPRRGSFNTQTGQYEIRSAGGFSLQAPSGMVRVSAADWGNIVREVASQVYTRGSI